MIKGMLNDIKSKTSKGITQNIAQLGRPLVVLLIALWALGQVGAAIAEPVVDINTATEQQLAKALKGIGEKKAQAIVAHRQQFGPFRTPVELTDVKGIGPKLLEKNAERIRVAGYKTGTDKNKTTPSISEIWWER